MVLFDYFIITIFYIRSITNFIMTTNIFPSLFLWTLFLCTTTVGYKPTEGEMDLNQKLAAIN